MDSECTLYSSLEEKYSAFNWTINNWNVIANKEGKFKPRSFTLGDSIITCGMTLNLSDWKILVSFDTNRPSTALLHSKTSIALVTQKKSNKILDDCSIMKEKYSDVYTYHFNLPEKDDVKEYIGTNGSLTFLCTVHYFRDKSVVRYNVNNEIKEEIISDDVESESHLYRKKFTLKNYGSLYEKNELCDVTFVTTGGELRAHTVILAIASPYFLAMFRHKNLKESTERVVDLTNDTDVTVEVFRGFLDYVYGLKSVESLKNIVMELLVLADKYDIQELKKACEQYLCDDLDEDNVSKLLYFSHKYSCEHLLKQALDLAKEDIDIIKESSEFDDIYKNKDLMLLLL